MTNAIDISPAPSAETAFPDLDQLRPLYKSAQFFAAILPWTYVNDNEVFGIVDPETGKLWYCMTRGMEHAPCGLIAMNGPLALDVMEKQNAPADPSNLDAILALGDVIPENDYLLAAFRGRADLAEADIKQINALNLKFHGARDWPVFRAVKNHAVDAMIDSDETRRLIFFLQQAADVARRRRRDANLTAVDSNGKILVRIPKKLKDGSIEWSDERRKREPLPEAPVPKYQEPSEEFIQELKKYDKEEKLLEFDYFWSDELTTEQNGLEYFTRAYALIDAESGAKIAYSIFDPAGQNASTAAVDCLLAFMLGQRKIYSNIKVSNPALASLLSELGEKIGMVIEKTDILPKINKYRQKNHITPLQALSDM